MESKLEAHIAVDKNRLKEYGDGNVYLKDGTNFQVELFNGERDTFGAVLELNGKPISNSKLVLRPGERIFLDRYIDDQVKFVFETYEVDIGDSKVRDAIKNNGNVNVKFYREREVTKNPPKAPFTTITNAGKWTFDGTLTVSGGSYYTASSGTIGNITYTSTTSATPTAMYLSEVSSGDSTVGYAVSSGMVSDSNTTAIRSANTVETGRVAKGGRSEQRIDTVDIHFEYLPEFEATLHILPESQKSSYSSGEIRSYCTGCGTRVRSRWRFCANCGESV